MEVYKQEHILTTPLPRPLHEAGSDNAHMNDAPTMDGQYPWQQCMLTRSIMVAWSVGSEASAG